MRPKPITQALAVWVVAFALRAADLHRILTVDEAYHWFARAAAFQAALAQGDLAGTNIIGHPGVTTMWLGAIGLWVQQGLAGLGLLPAPDLAAPVPTWIMLRLPVAATAATGIALSYLLLLRLLDAPTALLAALLLASDPMLVAFGRILHVDALLTIFMLLTVLLALVAFRYDLAPPASLAMPPPRWGYLAAAAVTGGLALLTKSPAVLLFPLVALIGALPLVQAVWQARQAGRPLRPQDWMPSVWPALAKPYLLWLLGLAVVWVLLWPAAWVDLPRAVGRVVNQVRFEGAEPHGWGNFFWGHAVADPGWLFYPVVLLLRLSIWTLPGLGLLLVARRQIPPPQWRTLLIVASMAAVVLLALTLPPKKFDRYALPAFPALVILAAAGWMAAARWLAQYCPAWAARLHALPAAVRWGVVVGGLTLHTLGYHPHYLAYYNPLFGGGPVAARLIPIGWGEGLEQAAAYLNRLPDGCQQASATWFNPVLSAFACGPVIRLPEPLALGRVEYAVLYIDQLQRENAPNATALIQQQGSAVYTVTLHGIPYATVYHLPQPIAQQPNVIFGGQIRLQGVELVRESDTLSVTTQWQALTPIAQDLSLFVHVLDAQGNRVSQIDVPPAGPDRPTSTWRTGHFQYWRHPLPLPPDLDLGEYWLAIGLYDPATFARLPVAGAVPPASDAPPHDADVLLLRGE